MLSEAMTPGYVCCKGLEMKKGDRTQNPFSLVVTVLRALGCSPTVFYVRFIAGFNPAMVEATHNFRRADSQNRESLLVTVRGCTWGECSCFDVGLVEYMPHSPTVSQPFYYDKHLKDASQLQRLATEEKTVTIFG